MGAYFVRRLMGGILALLFTTFVFHTGFFYAPTGVIDSCTEIRLDVPKSFNQYCAQVAKAYKLDFPWPLSYMLWLFDPQNNGDSAVLDDPITPSKLDISVLGWRIAGRGLLTGDFGTSLRVAIGSPALHVYRVELPTFLAMLIVPVVLLMLVAVGQRRGRLSVYSPAATNKPLERLNGLQIIG